MDKETWEKRIKEALAEIGLDKPQFSFVVASLAQILEQRDKAFKEYMKAGGQACIIKTSDRGAKNLAKNPLLSLWLDLNNTALAFWRELCLSPAALRKLSAEAVTGAEKSTTIEKLIEALCAETEKNYKEEQ